MIYKGQLNIDYYGCLKYGDNAYLLEDVECEFHKGDKVFVAYYISDKEITLNEAKQALIMKTCGGNVDELNFVLDAYSEVTINAYAEDFKVGGHDLFSELADHDGKYLILIIEKIE